MPYTQIREIMRDCKCAVDFHCDTYECMSNEYNNIPRGENVLEVGSKKFVCKKHAAEVLLCMKKEIDETLYEAKKLGWIDNAL